MSSGDHDGAAGSGGFDPPDRHFAARSAASSEPAPGAVSDPARDWGERRWACDIRFCFRGARRAELHSWASVGGPSGAEWGRVGPGGWACIGVWRGLLGVGGWVLGCGSGGLVRVAGCRWVGGWVVGGGWAAPETGAE